MRIARLLAPCVIASLAVAASAAWALASIPRSAAVALAVAMNAIRQIFFGTQGTRRARAVLGAVVLLTGVCLHTVPAFAATLTTTDGDVACSNTDLLQTQFESFTGTLSGPYGQPTGGTEPLLRDGVALTSSQYASQPSVWSANGNVWTYTLDTTVNTAGHDISEVNVYHGHNDAGRDGQAFKVGYSKVATPDTYVTLYDMGTTMAQYASWYGKTSNTAATADGAKVVKRIMITFNAV